MEARFEAEAPGHCEAMGLTMTKEPVGHFDPVAFDESCVHGRAQCGRAVGI